MLYYKPGVPLAVIEAKDNNHGVSAGMQQAIATGELIDVPFIFSSNGDAFMMSDRTITEGQREREIPLNQFPTPKELWQKYCDWKGINSDIQPIVAQDYYPSPDKKQPRYYQQIAINRISDCLKSSDRFAKAIVEENEFAWKVSIADLKANNYNLDIKNRRCIIRYEYKVLKHELS